MSTGGHYDDLWAEWRSAGAYRNDSGDPIMPPDLYSYSQMEDCSYCPYHIEDECRHPGKLKEDGISL